MRIKWQADVIKLIPCEVPNQKREHLLAEFGQFLYDYICQLHHDSDSNDINSDSASQHLGGKYG